MAKEISSELLNTILTRVGGPGNIASCGNCMTRLRLGVHDSSLVDPNIKTLEGVKGVILTSDQVQVVFGPGKAHRAAKAMSELLGEAPVQDAAEIAAQNKRQLKAKQTSGVQQFLAKFATIFTPLIPGFIAAGLLLGIATLIATVMHVPADAQGTLPDALNFMKVFSKGLFTFLVILVGYNAAQAFGGTGVNGAIIAALFCSVITLLPPLVTTPDFTILWSAHRSARQYYRRVDCRVGLRPHRRHGAPLYAGRSRHAVDLVNHPADHRYAGLPDHYAAGRLAV